MDASMVKRYVGKMYRDFPVLSQADLDAANDLFPHYLFFRHDRKTGKHHLWTSCCHVEDYVIEDQRTISGTVKNCIWLRHNEISVCPFCGRTVTAKDLSKAGKRKNLRAWRPVVFLHAEEDTPLYAQAYVAYKDFAGMADLSAYPTYRFEAAYIFRPGDPVLLEEDYWRDGKLIEMHGKPTRDPFRVGMIGGYRYEPYYVIGRDALARSCMRYSQYDAFRCSAELDSAMMRYLSTYCLYPQIEMLMRLGLRCVVSELVYSGKKNAAAIDWKQSDPRKAFGLTKPELRAFLEQKYPDVDDVAMYKRLRRHGIRVNFLQWLGVPLSHDNRERLMKICLTHQITPERAMHYLNRFSGRQPGGYYTCDPIIEHWADYLSMAAALEYDLTDDVVLFPRDVIAAHDTAAELIGARQAALESARFRELTEQHEKRYAFHMAGYHIRPPRSTDEIIKEGQALKHCVGGYATRHAEGVMTILFLRSDTQPWTPLVTIEMNGKRLVQIHGYQNDRYASVLPKERYAAILTPWLEWVANGSRRDKNGDPIIKQKEVISA